MGISETLEFHYQVVNLTPPDLHSLMAIGYWLQQTFDVNSYGFDLRSNTWKFARQEDYVLFLLTWS